MDKLKLPNLRAMFIPDPGYTIVDIDLAGADARVVAWESDDVNMKALFRENIKIAAFVAKEVYGAKAGDGKAEPWYSRAKAGGHLTNYLGTSRTLATTMGISTHEADRFQHHYFSMFPGVKLWHERLKSELNATRTVWNRFGYRRIYFDRTENIIKEAAAWIPQSTVACVTNRAWVAIDESALPAEVLLQVHDSLVLQIPTRSLEPTLRSLQPLIQITVPYDDPLVIPWGLKVSGKSWGDCSGRTWP